jgi:hypothetical protein
MTDESQSNDVAEPSPPPRADGPAPVPTPIVLGFVIGLHVLFILIFFDPTLFRGTRHGMEFIAGVLLSQPILFAVWAGLGPQPFYRRFLLSFLLCTLVSFVEEAGYLRHQRGDAGVIMIFDLAFFFVATGVFSAVRRITGWRIQRDTDTGAAGDYRANQFGIKHIILLTSVTALAAGLLRSVFILAQDQPQHIPGFFEFLAMGGTMLAMLLPPAFFVWFALARRPNLPGLIGYAVLAVFAVDLLVGLLAPAFIPDREFFFSVLMMQFAAAVSVLVTTLPFRFCDYRMVRSRKGTNHGASAGDAVMLR